jgi:hypothetical protein
MSLLTSFASAQREETSIGVGFGHKIWLEFYPNVSDIWSNICAYDECHGMFH